MTTATITRFNPIPFIDLTPHQRQDVFEQYEVIARRIAECREPGPYVGRCPKCLRNRRAAERLKSLVIGYPLYEDWR